MSISRINFDKPLKHTIFISATLHLLCFSCITFTFAGKTKYSLDLSVDFLGSILKKTDVLASAEFRGGYFGSEPLDIFLLRKHQSPELYRYLLFTNKPSYKLQSLFSSKKPFSVSIGARSDKKAEADNKEEIGQPPEWGKDLKLKIK